MVTSAVSRAQRIPKLAITTFIVFNITAILCGSNAPLARQNGVQRFFYPYLLRTRLLQSWKLFTPSPRKYSVNYRAEISFRDGKTATWRRPYPPNWGFFERHLAYHFQKYDLASNYLEMPGYANLLWPDLGVYLTRLYWDPSNPPKKITFIRSTAEIPPPQETGDARVERDPIELRWADSIAFNYDVPEGFSP